MSSDMTAKTYSPSGDFPITTPSGRVVEPPTGRAWAFSKESYERAVKDNRIWFGPDGNGVPRTKRFLSELKHDGLAPTSILFYKDVGHSQEGSQELVSVFDGKGYFDGPKPTRLLSRLMTIANLQDDSIVLDFFSGSASTADALLKYNKENRKHCRFILVQLPETTDPKRDANKDGYPTICDIGEERIRRIGKSLSSQTILDGNKIDSGFRVFRIDSSNMNDVFYDPQSMKKSLLDYSVDNIKFDRSGEDLLFQVMLEFGIELSAKINKEMILGKEVFTVDDGYLVACFDEGIQDDVVTEIAKHKPRYAVFRDSSMSSDAVAINFGEIFKTFSPDTRTKVF